MNYHFPCYFKQFMESDLLTSLSIFSCPLCNRLSETYVPMVIQYTDERIKDFFKGFDFTKLLPFKDENDFIIISKEEREADDEKIVDKFIYNYE